MNPVTSLLGCLMVSYLCGALPWGLWLGRLLRGVDVRRMGSGNLGATNVYRSLGPGIGITTLVLDMAKGALPVVLLPGTALAADFPGGPAMVPIACGLAAVVGHMFTVFAGFRGGKGVATTAGVLLALSPPAFGVFAVLFLGTVAVTRWISLGSMLGSVGFAVTLAWLSPGGVRSPAALFGIAVAVLVIVRHRDNIGRLIRGEERRFALRRGGS